MAGMRVNWTKRAMNQRIHQARWFVDNCGIEFAQTFNSNIDKSVSQIALMPNIGQKEKSTRDGKSVRSVLAHPKCRIIYRYDDKTITIIRLRFMMMRE